MGSFVTCDHFYYRITSDSVQHKFAFRRRVWYTAIALSKNRAIYDAHSGTAVRCAEARRAVPEAGICARPPHRALFFAVLVLASGHFSRPSHPYRLCGDTLPFPGASICGFFPPGGLFRQQTWPAGIISRKIEENNPKKEECDSILELYVKDDRKLVEIWLTNAEKKDLGLRESLKGIFDKYKRKKYRVEVFESGEKEL